MAKGNGDNRTVPQPARCDGIVVHELDGEAVVHDERSGAVHRLNDTALTVWKACDGSRRVREIAQLLAERYALDPNEARIEVGNVIADLEANGLLTDVPGQGEAARHRSVDQPGSTPERWKSANQREGSDVSNLPSRRELLRGGVGKLIYTAPMIATIFAAEAQAYNFSCYLAGHACPGNEPCCNGLICCTNPGTCGTSTAFEACTSNNDCCTGFCFFGIFCTG